MKADGPRGVRNEDKSTAQLDEDALAKSEALKRRVNPCPYYQLLGMELLEAANGKSLVRLSADARLHQPVGLVQGGVIASICDAACGLALMSLLDLAERSPTLELKVNYFLAITEDELIAEGRVVHRGRRIGVTEVEVRGRDKRLVAKGLATFMIE